MFGVDSGVVEGTIAHPMAPPLLLVINCSFYSPVAITQHCLGQANEKTNLPLFSYIVYLLCTWIYCPKIIKVNFHSLFKFHQDKHTPQKLQTFTIQIPQWLGHCVPLILTMLNNTTTGIFHYLIPLFKAQLWAKSFPLVFEPKWRQSIQLIE